MLAGVDVERPVRPGQRPGGSPLAAIGDRRARVVVFATSPQPAATAARASECEQRDTGRRPDPFFEVHSKKLTAANRGVKVVPAKPNTIRIMRRKDQRARREQLVEAARAVMAERGAVAIRVKDVAERAGVSPSSLLYYYPDFEELLFAVARDAIDRYTEERAAAVRREPRPARAAANGDPARRPDRSRRRAEQDPLRARRLHRHQCRVRGPVDGLLRPPGLALRVDLRVRPCRRRLRARVPARRSCARRSSGSRTASGSRW